MPNSLLALEGRLGLFAALGGPDSPSSSWHEFLLRTPLHLYLLSLVIYIDPSGPNGPASSCRDSHLEKEIIMLYISYMKFKLWLENEELLLAKANKQGVKFETGKPVTFQYLRGRDKAPFFGPTYQQDIEPAGRYLIHNEDPGDRAEDRWEVGQITFHNPLVIKFNPVDDVSYDENSWKARLAKHYKKIGKNLSKAIVSDGYDGVVTVGQGPYTKEIVDLTMFR